MEQARRAALAHHVDRLARLGIYDLTERKRHEQKIQLLMREVNHRSKNILSLVQSVARLTAVSNPVEFISLFSERMQALAASQDLLVKGDWKGVALDELAQSQLAHFRDRNRIELSGGSLVISASAAQTIGMALHELATNAGKYGALSNDEGRVAIRWRLNAGASGYEFTIAWTERGGPPVVPPTRHGFGSTVIDRMAKTSLGADVMLNFALEGLEWRLRCPAENVLEGGASVLPVSRPEPSLGRVLVVEDEALVALEIEAILTDAGFDVIGPADSVGLALDLLERSTCGAAILDVNLGSETAEPIALELLRRGTPFVIVSGYAREQQPLSLREAPLLTKPFRPEALVARIRECLATPGGSDGPRCAA